RSQLVGKAPPDPSRRRWLNFYGPRGSLPSIRYDRLLEQPATETNLFGGQILFVGWHPTRPTGPDEHRATYTRWTGQTIPGVELHATAYLNLVRREWLQEVPG